MRRLILSMLAVFASSVLFAQNSPTPIPQSPPNNTGSLSSDQIRDIVRESADKDMENDKRQRDYTYVQREEEHHLDGDGRVKSTEIRTKEIMILYGEQVARLVAKDDKPLPEKDAAKEEERIRKLIEKHEKENDSDRAKRMEKEQKQHEEDRKFVGEIADAYTFRLVGSEMLDGHDTYVIDADPQPGFEPHSKDAKFLPKFRFRAWIDKTERQWLKLDIRCIDTVSVGLFLVRLHQGSSIQIEQTRINDEVWLPKHVALKVDARVALLKGFNVAEDVTYRDYRKFRADTKIVPVGEAPAHP